MLEKALNASSLLLAYHADLVDKMSVSLTPDLWDELCVVTELCLRLHRCAAQASGRGLALMITGEKARWLNLPLSEEGLTPQHPCGPQRLIRPSGSHRAETLQEEERVWSTTTVSPHESATPSPHCTLADVCRSQGKPLELKGISQETLRCQRDTWKPSCPSCYSRA